MGNTQNQECMECYDWYEKRGIKASNVTSNMFRKWTLENHPDKCDTEECIKNMIVINNCKDLFNENKCKSEYTKENVKPQKKSEYHERRTEDKRKKDEYDEWNRQRKQRDKEQAEQEERYWKNQKEREREEAQREREEQEFEKEQERIRLQQQYEREQRRKEREREEQESLRRAKELYDELIRKYAEEKI
jgi:hypothetical protein